MSERGGCAAELVGDTLLVMIAWGHGEPEVARPFIAELEKLVGERTNVVAFNDLERLETYRPEFRSAFDRWGETSAKSILKIHVLVRSKVVAMAIAVFAMFDKRMASYSDRADWERALRAAGGKPLQPR